MPLSRSHSARAVAVLSAAALGAVFTGCNPTKSFSDEVAEVGGAKIAASTSAVQAGQPVTFDISGSTMEDAAGACPDIAYFFADEETGSEETLDDLKTLKQDGTCSVVDGKVTIPMKAPVGTQPGATADQEVKVAIAAPTEPGAEKAMYESYATTTVKVTVPGAPAATPVAETPAAPPPAPGTPAPETLKPKAISCGSTPTHPADFTWNFTVNPSTPVAGQVVEWDASRTNPKTKIVRYDWDTDGDGTSDKFDTTPVLTFTPAAAGTVRTCLAATDANGAVATHAYELAVQPSSKQGAAPFTITPAVPAPGQKVTFTPPSPVPAGADFLCVYYGVDQEAPQGEDYDCGPPSGTFEHTYAAAGDFPTTMNFINTSTSDSNGWTKVVSVKAAAQRAGARAAAVKPRPRAKSRKLTLTTPLRTTARLLSAGRVRFSDGEVLISGGRAAGRFRSTLKQAARSKVPPSLRFLLDADFVMSIDGRRVPLSPGTFGVAGKGKVLAQARKDRKTRVCLTFTSDGMTQAKTVWKVAGATGRAAGHRGGGLASPPVLGTASPAGGNATLTVTRAGKRKGVGACSTLVRSLPKAKARTRAKAKR